ncbi:MAG: S9 family peptidase [Chloroflexi bacterium]|nr:S9 family peptidase [Chloroflexota bacterium]
MTDRKIAPYGSWKSPITSDVIVSEKITLAQPTLDGDDLYWSEMRAAEKGRYVIVRRTPDGKTTDLTPMPFNARTRVHEYGGGAFVVDRGTIFFSNFADQRLYRQDPGSAPRPLTPAVDLRYADGVMDRERNRIICVREDHTAPGEAVNTLVSVNIDGDDAGGTVLVSGNNFYSNPRLSPDGKRLAWLTWNHPNMPWDGTELWIGNLDGRGAVSPSKMAHAPKLVAGGIAESIFQPEWSPDGTLYFVSDKTGWWNFYRLRDGNIEPLCPMDAEFGRPAWVFKASTYAFESNERIVCTFKEKGQTRFATLNTTTRQLDRIDLPFTEIASVRAASGRALFIAGSPSQSLSIVLLDLKTHQTQILKESEPVSVDAGYLSTPQAIEFPIENGLTAHAFFYPPTNRDFAAPRDDKPPLIVMSHGGPTSAATTELDLEFQYWTSRGFAVVDVNYGGSTGYGRAYRMRLNDNWGIVDVNDCVNAARYLIQRGDVDGNRIAIRGGSAGGYTTLAALVFTDVFKAGASYYGISDLETMTRDTHKFESRYLDNLIGPYPARRDIYLARSPIHFIDRLACPLILFQGLEDQVVPPDQSAVMFEAVKKKGLPTAYLAFEGEQHGFRQAKNIKRALDAEAYFYSKVFKFDLADAVDLVKIENLNNV